MYLHYFYNCICLLIMSFLMNMSIQAIFLKSSKNKSLVKACVHSFTALVSGTVFQLALACIFIAEYPSYYESTLSRFLIQPLIYLCIFCIPFILALISMRKKGILLVIPVYIEIVSVMISINAIRFFDELLPWCILVIIISTIYMIRMFTKYNQIMSAWNFDTIESINLSVFSKSIVWGILLGVFLASWIGLLYSSSINNNITFGFLMIVGGLSLLVASVLLYLIPTIVAVKRKHLQKIPIILVNIFLGWSLIGWVVSLVWACTQSKPKIVHIHNESQSMDLGQKLRSLDDLHKSGLITDKEYDDKKSELIKNY